MGNMLLTAIALMLILEGCAPLLAPVQWRRVLLYLTGMKDGQIRYIGLSSALAGIALLLLQSVWN